MDNTQQIVPNLTIKTPTDSNYTSNKSTSRFSINSYTWTLQYAGAAIDPDTVPILVLDAWQPKRQFYPVAALEAGAANSLVTAAQGLANGALLGPAAELAAQTGYNALSRVSMNQDSLNRGYSYITDMFNGSIDLNMSYELPFLTDRFAEAEGSLGWEDRGINNVTDAAVNLSKLVLDRFGFNAPLQPTWSATAVKSNAEIPIEFFLVNDSENHLKNNIEFLFSFLPNCYWAQLGTMQQPPNIFKANVAGRLKWEWVSVSTSVTFVGRVRAYTATSATNAENSVSQVPDMYKMSVTVKNLCPNNLNAFGALFGGVSTVPGSTAESLTTDSGKKMTTQAVKDSIPI